jgi:hypothetical protein
MAEYRQIHVRIWDDDWFAPLSSNYKVLWVYLFSNRRASICGIYLLPERIIPAETGLSSNVVARGLVQFETDGKIERYDNWIWVKKLRDIQAKGSKKLDTCIEKDLTLVPSCPMKTHYLIRYGYPIDSLSGENLDCEIGYLPARALIRDRDVHETEPEPKPRAPAGEPDHIHAEPLARAYVDTFLPGGILPQRERQRALAAILWLQKHPCYPTRLGTPEQCVKALEKFRDERADTGDMERKPITYIIKWLEDRITAWGKTHGALAEDWVFEEAET